MENRKLNIELFKKVRERIATIPESYDQGGWCMSNPASPCGTSACLAGEAVICDAPTVEEGVRRLRSLMMAYEPHAVPLKAAELLGLKGDYGSDDPEETAIFYAHANGWPQPWSKRFMQAEDDDDPNGMAAIAVAYLDHIIETGKVLE